MCIFCLSSVAMAYGRPMASVRPIISSNLGRAGGSSLPINTFLKPGVSLHQVKTTTGKLNIVHADVGLFVKIVTLLFSC